MIFSSSMSCLISTHAKDLEDIAVRFITGKLVPCAIETQHKLLDPRGRIHGRNLHDLQTGTAGSIRIGSVDRIVRWVQGRRSKVKYFPLAVWWSWEILDILGPQSKKKKKRKGTKTTSQGGYTPYIYGNIIWMYYAEKNRKEKAKAKHRKRVSDMSVISQPTMKKGREKSSCTTDDV